ncbi:helix-turn-helix domain-containing protein [Micavibrio aeruginosavorus]|uniref:helix-turn-helix domain-containing protein n=1 Tax=Micavibrio aeruginosavorus TaxID=349221 RepID=UPI0005A1E3D4|nr:helix-turn-helix domain-containing protein [Micavibrio aeruginosavorus]
MQLSYSIDEVSVLTGIGKTKLYSAISNGSLSARKFGKRTLVLKDDIDRFLNQLPQIQSEGRGA